VAVSADAPVFFFAQGCLLSDPPNADCRNQPVTAKSFDWPGPRPAKELVFHLPRKMPGKNGFKINECQRSQTSILSVKMQRRIKSSLMYNSSSTSMRTWA